MPNRIGKNKKKVLLLLFGGLALGLSGSPRKYFQILGAMREEWREIDGRGLRRSIRSLYNSQLVREHFSKNGTITLVLTQKGRNVALTYAIEPMEIKAPKRWDGKWRVIIFDIPEKRKKVRDTFRFHLQHMNFYELQKSVFVHPFECARQIRFLTKKYRLRKCVRFIRADFIEKEKELKKHFHLLQKF